MELSLPIVPFFILFKDGSFFTRNRLFSGAAGNRPSHPRPDRQTILSTAQRKTLALSSAFLHYTPTARAPYNHKGL